MDFVGSMKEIKAGKKVRRAGWPDKKINVALDSGMISIKNEDGFYHPWMISEADVYAQDWEVKFDA